MVFTRRQNLQRRIRNMPREVRITIFKYLDVDVDVLFEIPVFLFKEWFNENKQTGRVVGKKLWLRLYIQFALEVPCPFFLMTPLEKERFMENKTSLSKVWSNAEKLCIENFSLMSEVFDFWRKLVTENLERERCFVCNGVVGEMIVIDFQGFINSYYNYGDMVRGLRKKQLIMNIK